MFVTRDRYVGGELGSLEDADTVCTQASIDGSPHRAILNGSTTTAAERIEILGPVFNTLGQVVATDAATLWSGMAAADVGFDENGDPISRADLAWIGSSDANCQDWSTPVFGDTADFGVPTDPNLWLGNGRQFQCGLGLHLYCISI